MSPIKKLGVFDSGVGGLAVLQDLVTLPIQEFIYCADTLNLPYGQKTKSQIEQLTLNAISLLIDYDVDAIIIACHTASANAYEFVKSHFPDLLLFDVVSPSVQQALHATRNSRIGIIGTQATIASAIHQSKILSHQPKAFVFNQACPLFVPLIEAGLHDKDGLHRALETYLNPLLAHNIDTLIIGCTHYEIIVDHIRNVIGTDITIVSVPPLMHQEIAHAINQTKTQSELPIPIINYLVSGDIQQFQSNALNLLNWKIQDDRIKIANLLPVQQLNPSEQTIIF